jgi:hypothetical protein
VRARAEGAVVSVAAPFATRRARDVNHGDRTPLRGGGSKTLGWISVDASQAFTVYATARVQQPSTATVVAMVSIEWGHGGASVVSEYAVIKRLRVPLVGSMVKLSGRLVDAATGKPAGADVTGEITVTIAPGSDGETLRSTWWVAQSGAEGLVARGQQRVLTLDGYNCGASACWIMAFDDVARPADGTPPVMARPAATFPRTFRLRRFDTRGFLRGIYWAASSTPLLLTFEPSASLRVDTELLT